MQGRAHVRGARAAEVQIGQNRPRHGEPYNAIGGPLCAITILSPEFDLMNNFDHGTPLTPGPTKKDLETHFGSLPKTLERSTETNGTGNAEPEPDHAPT